MIDLGPLRREEKTRRGEELLLERTFANEHRLQHQVAVVFRRRRRGESRNRILAARARGGLEPPYVDSTRRDSSLGPALAPAAAPPPPAVPSPASAPAAAEVAHAVPKAAARTAPPVPVRTHPMQRQASLTQMTVTSVPVPAAGSAPGFQGGAGVGLAARQATLAERYLASVRAHKEETAD